MAALATLARALRLPAAIAGLAAVAGFSCDDFGPLPAFDAERAFADLEAQVAFGPRVPGTEAHRRCRAYVVESLEEAGGRVSVQAFHDPEFPLEGVDSLYNVRARFGPESGPYLVLGAHWDTRPWAEQDPDPEKRAEPVPGANDGASGVAVLLELARAFGETPPPVGVEIVLFDGEDAGDPAVQESYCRGSQGYVARLEHPRPVHAVIVDMVGRRGMTLYHEGNSFSAAPALVERIWDGAGKVDAEVFRNELRHWVYDDHVPFIRGGIPAVDLIDMDDPYWHTTADRPDHCSPASLAAVGRTLLWHVFTLETELE